MDDLETGPKDQNTPQPKPETGPEAGPRAEKKRRWIFSSLVSRGVRFTLVLSLLLFGIYTAGSMPDPGFSDRALFLLLRFLRYSSLMLSAFSLFALGYSVHRVVYKFTLRNAAAISFYFFTGVLGAVLAMLNSFIVAAAGGNI
ncbi:MAG: hypothetical protein FWH38_06715 [Treponema sp.]|nr:hypothetical protein [Treponema sp.]